MRNIYCCWTWLLTISFCFLITSLSAQVRLRVIINNGSSSTTCTDGFFGGSPDPQWRVNVDNDGWTTYPQSGICFSNTPNTQYDETFDCPSAYPNQIEVCFRAFEDDGGACIVSQSCQETTCQNFTVPAPGTSSNHTLSVSGSSSGSVNFTIIATGAFNLPGSNNDVICDAINLGTLPSGGSVGDNSLSNYGNFCAGNAGDPNPPNWNNEQGVWFQFTTGAFPSAVIRIDATNDPAGRGDQIDLQLALYESSNGTCSGSLTRINSEHTIPLYSEEMQVECLQPNTTYFLLVDGADNGIFGGQEGFFGLEIFDDGILQAADEICDAEHLGAVPNGGSVSTPNLSRSNVCATNTNDPTPANWTPDQSVWFSFEAPATGHVIVETDSDLPFPFGTDAIDLQVAVYGTNTGTCTGTLEFMGSEYDPIIFDEDADIRCLIPGETYWIMIDGSGLNVEGIFDVTVSDGGIPPAPNDLICDAIPLGQPAPGGTVGLNNQNNYCANNLFEPLPNNWGNDMGVWYTFIAPPSGKVEVRADSDGPFGDPIDLQLAVYDASNMTCTGTLTELASEHSGIGLIWDEDMEVECLIPGRTYFILVDGEGSLIDPGLQEGIFDIEVYGDPRDPPAPNDDICNAVALGDPTGTPVGTVQTNPNHHSQNNFCATAAGEPQPSGFTADQTVWYSFVAPASGNVEIELESDAVIVGEDPIDLQIAVWESSNNACTGTLNEFVSGDDLLYDVDLEIYCLTPGQTYFVQVDGAPPAILGGEEGYFDITITELPPIPVAPNDLICDAVALGDPFAAGTVGAVNQHNLCADDTGDPNPSAFGTDQTVWYTFTTPATGGPYAVDVDATSSLPWPFGNQDAIDLQIAVFASGNNLCTGALSEIESEYDPIIFNESVEVQCLEAGQTYFVMVDGSFFDDQGYFDIEISPTTSVPIPTNNDICDAINLGNVPISGSLNNNIDYFNFCADTEPGEPSPFGIEQTVWFSFVAPNHTGANATSEVTVSVDNDPNNVGNSVDLQLAVYESSNGTCTGNMSLLDDGSSNPAFSFDAEVNLTCLEPGETYFVQVDGALLNPEGYFTIEVEDDGAGVHLPNDDICDPVALGTVPNGGSINDGVNYQNFCAGTQSGEPNPNAFGIEQTMWFEFQAPPSGNVTIDLESDPNNLGDEIDLQVALYFSSTNDCTGSFIEVESDYNPFGFDESMTVECLVPGGTYFVQVDGAGGGLLGGEEGYFTIEIEDDGGTTNFPYNNDICDAYNFGVPTGLTQVLNNETTECANVEFGEPGVGNYATNTVWYTFIAPPSGRVEISVQANDIFFGVDPEVYLFSSSTNTCTGGLSEIESSSLPTSLITENIEATCLIPGQTYFIQVDGSGLNTEDDFTIEIEDMEPNYGTGVGNDPEPSNNYCVDAIPLTVQSESCFNGTGIFQQFNYGQPTITYNSNVSQNCNDNCGDTWYSFTMPQSGIALVEGNDDNIGGGLLGDFSDLTVTAYTGNCNGLTPIDCEAGGLTDDVAYEITAAPGSTVYLQVFNDDGDDDDEDYEICVSEGCGADNCLNALAYPIQPNIPYCFNTGAANGEDVAGGAPGYVECGEGDNPEHSIYYYFVSDCNGSAVTLSIINATINGNCILGTTPTDGFGISFFQDSTPCDGNPDALVDCQLFNSCDPQPVNWTFTYTNLLPNTPYIVQIEGGFNVLGGDNSGYFMVETTTNPVIIPTSTPASCSGIADGTATATTVGGLPPFTFAWSHGSTDSIATGLTPGTYEVTVTSANGCFDTASVVVGSPNPMDAVLNNTVDASCNGVCDGSATVAGLGGTITTGYTYQWDANAGNQTTATATGLCAGNYVVTVFDNGGCSDTLAVTINEPIPIVASVVSTVDVTCSGFCDGEGTVSATGGTAVVDYIYEWGASAGNQTTATATGLCVGNYMVTITDDNGCVDSISVTIGQPLSVDGSIANQTDVACNGDATGSVEISTINGTIPYQYDIGGGAGASNVFTGLAAGNYTVTVSDANGCFDTVNVTIAEPPLLTAQLITTIDVSCNGATDGAITVAADVGTGTAPYEYSLDGVNFVAIGSFTGLAAGNYTVTVRDANGCLTTVNGTINEPNAIVITVDGQTQASCGVCDGTASITISGGAAPYTYAWSGGETIEDPTTLCSGTNTVTVTDDNGCTATTTLNIGNSASFAVTSNIDQSLDCAGDCDGVISITPNGGTAPYNFVWNTGATTSSIANLCVGTYTATITDANGCFVVENIDLTEPQPLLTLVAMVQAASCAGGTDGQAIATPSGGTAPYTYLWDNGELTQTALALDAGSHDVTVTDANSCETIGNVVITEPTTLALSVVSIDSSDCGVGGCNGGAVVSGSGGTAPYTYAWSNGNSTPNPIDLCPGFNTVTITDANGCTDSVSVNIPANTNLNLAIIATTDASCAAVCDGSAIVSASGGNAAGGYTFAWNDPAGQTTANVTGLCVGTYQVTVSDVDGCIASDSVVIGVGDAVIPTLQLTTGITCNAAADAVLDATVVGGTAPYTYDWMLNGVSIVGNTGGNLTNANIGSYTVEVTDINGCQGTSNVVVVTEPTEVDVTAVVTSNYSGFSVSCNGATDGDAQASGTGGTGTITYDWSNNATTDVINNIGAGTYTVTVTDDNGCEDSATVVLTEPGTFTANLTLDQGVLCNGGTNGGATTNLTGGIAPFTYLWSNGETTASATNLAGGSQSVTVTDLNGCIATATIIIPEPVVLALDSTVSDVSCNGLLDGTAEVVPTGGTAPYTYNWFNGATTAQITAGAGTYNVIVTDANGCQEAIDITISEPALLTSTASILTDYNGFSVSCNGSADGSAEVVPTGGTLPYTFAWSDGQSTAIATGLSAQTYDVTVTDGNGCTTTASVTLTEPTVLTSIASILTDYNGFSVSCNGSTDGSAEVVPAGGVAPYTFAWSDGQGTAIATNLGEGTYNVTVTDDNGCTSTASVTLTEPTVLTSTASILTDYNGFSVSCNGSTDGSAEVVPTGGVAPYTFAWSDGQSTATATNLGVGTYTVTVTDDNGCISTASVTLTEPTLLTSSISLLQDVSCNGGLDGSAEVVISGGVMPYTYAWDNGEITAIATSLDAGNHSVTITDLNGCFVIENITIGEPTALALSFNVNNVSCNAGIDGSVEAVVTGGTQPYTYAWSNSTIQALNPSLTAGIYIVTVTDANNCVIIDSVTITEPTPIITATTVDSDFNGEDISCPNSNDGAASVTSSGGTGNHTYQWTNGETTSSITGLFASNYYVTVTDDNGCIAIDSIELLPPPVLTLNATVLTDYNGYNVSCASSFDGTVDVTASGGVAPYTYIWSDGQTTATSTGMGAGVYEVTVTDANGCIAVVFDTLTAPDLLLTTMTGVQDASCNGFADGQAIVNVTGGVMPYTYAWDNGETTAVNLTLDAGLHTVTITDANNCSTIETVIINEPTALSISGTTQEVSCNGGSDGEASVTVIGGTQPYTYAWDNGQTTATATGLSAGSHTVTVTDANNCVIALAQLVTEPTLLEATINVDSDYNGSAISCDGASDGALLAVGTGGVAPYNFAWDTGDNTDLITGLVAGTYEVTITDANNCIAIESITINNPAPVVANATVTSDYNGFSVSCNGSSDGEATATGSGGTAPYTYIWSDGQTTATATGLSAQTYDVTVTDANGCTAVTNVVLTAPSAMELDVALLQDITCFGANDGQAEASASGSVGPYTYVWSGGQTTAIATGLTPGIHNVMATDLNGCTISGAISVTEPSLLVIGTDAVQAVSCHGGNDGVAAVVPAGGTSPYTYIWSDGQTGQAAQNVVAGTYDVTVTDANGCTVGHSVTVLEPIAISVTFTNVSDVLCNNGTDGSATATANGGTAPYTYLWNGVESGQTATNLSAGNNYVLITDANGCQYTDTVFIDNPNPLVVDTMHQNILCVGDDNGYAEVIVSGGTVPYVYNWSNSETTSSISDLPAGSYTVTITDANGCEELVTFVIDQPDAALALEFVQLQNLSCPGDNDGYIVVAAVGGVAPYDFVWSNGATTTGSFAIFDETLDSLDAGDYSVTLTDANGCAVTFDTTILEPSALTAIAQGNETRCADTNDGSITVFANGGTPPYMYSIDGGILASDSIFTGLAAGIYDIGVSDASGCLINIQGVVSAPDSVQLVVPDDMQITLGESVNLSVFMPVNAPDNPQVIWSPSIGLSCDTCYQLTATPPQTTQYVVTIVGDDNCPVSTDVWVYVDANYEVYIPNAFSPNGDGTNDVLMIYSTDNVEAVEEFAIYDRWGEEVFRAENFPTNFSGFGWDGMYKGKPSHVGVYAFYAEVRFIDGSTTIIKGDVTLIR